MVEQSPPIRAPSVASIDYLPNNRPWRILIPPVYRYLPQVFVDRFFETGELRLSTIAQFHQHIDEARLDTNEGRFILRAVGGERELWALGSHSLSSYILCGSLLCKRSLMHQFPGAEAAIEITNIADFALEIARQLAGFRSGISGLCIYGDGATLTREVAVAPLTLPPEGEKVSFQQLFDAVDAGAQNEQMFLKHTDFAYQAEYRLVWNVDVAPAEPIIVRAPLARQFCRKIDGDQIR